MLRFIGSALLVLLLITAGYAAVNWQTVMQIIRFSPVVLPPLYGTPSNRTEAMQQDIRFLRRLIDYDRSFSSQEQRAFNAHLDALNRRAGQLSEAEFFLGISRAAAISDNGHTNVGRGQIHYRFNSVGIRVFWFSDGLFVVRAHKDHADLVGARIVDVEGIPVDKIYQRLSYYFGGAENFRRLYSSMLFESPQLMNAAGLSSSPDSLSLNVADASGTTRIVTLRGTSIKAAQKPVSRWPVMTLSPAPLAEEGNEWRRTLELSNTEIPLYLRNPDDNFLWTRIDGGVYLRPRLLLERKETPILANFEAILKAGASQAYSFMIVDLRQSPGGDYTKTIDFAKAAPKAMKPGGHIYIVTGPQTFSAAVVATALLKHHGGEMSVIAGEQPGDREQFWAETGLPFKLPNSGYAVNYATGYHDWADGCAGKHPYCFDLNLIHEVKAGSLAPTLAVSPSYADYARGRDVVMDRIMDRELPK